ncbi:MAG: AI-2E family transporter [Candidatus Palauibacterales bacterium]|nr:AI-2E family transporter [Candidatus Palauibacterales bacterium]
MSGERDDTEADSPEGAPVPAPDLTDLSRVRLGALIVLGLAGVYTLGRLLWPFLPALMISAVAAALVYPAYRRFEAWIGQRDVAAFLGTTAVFFLVLLPVVGLSLLLVDQVLLGIDWATKTSSELLQPGGLVQGWLDTLSGYAGALGIEPSSLSRQVTQQMQGLASTLAGRTFSFLSGLGGWLLQGGVALFTLFYMLRDAEVITAGIKWLIPLDDSRTEHLFRRARDVTYATMFGTVAVALVQGTLGGVTFWILDLPAAALWGTVMGVVALVPGLGPPLVWIPAAAILFATGDVARGLALVAIGGLIVGTVDNVLRAVLVAGRAQLHSLAVLLSVLGGLFLFGGLGIFVGPVLFVVALSLIEMARLALEPGGDMLPAEDEGLLLSRIPGREEEEEPGA